MATICRMSLRNNQQVAKRQVKQDNKAGHRIPRAKPRAAAAGSGKVSLILRDLPEEVTSRHSSDNLDGIASS